MPAGEIPNIDPSKNVLIIEDDKSTADILGNELDILRVPKGQQRFEANLGGAITAIKERIPDLVVLDLMLPNNEPGTLLFDKAFQETHGIPPLNILVISASLTPDLAQSLMNHGAVRCLLKPFDLVEFDETVERYMNLK